MCSPSDNAAELARAQPRMHLHSCMHCCIGDGETPSPGTDLRLSGLIVGGGPGCSGAISSRPILAGSPKGACADRGAAGEGRRAWMACEGSGWRRTSSKGFTGVSLHYTDWLFRIMRATASEKPPEVQPEALHKC